MKQFLFFSFLLFLLFINLDSNAQDLEINPSTKLVSVMDTIPLTLTNYKTAYDLIQKWKRVIGSAQTIKEVFQIQGEWEILQIAINPPIDPESNSYVDDGFIYYLENKTNRLLGTYTPNTSNGMVNFTMRYTINKSGIIYEFTNLNFKPGAGGGTGIGNSTIKGNAFEEESMKINGVSGIIPAVAKHKKLWAEIKSDYYKRMDILSIHFKTYITNYFATNNQSNVNSFANGHISYDTYKKIQSGMNYDAVIKILGDEGRELSNNVIKKDNKEVNELVVVWYASEDNRDKYIKLVIIDKIVTSKSQANL